MAYLYLNKKGKYKYYVIRKCIRKNGKISVKDIKYIGKEISKGKLKKIEKEIGTKITNSNKHLYEKTKENIKENKYFDKKQLAEINSVLKHQKNNFKKRSKKIQNKKKEKYETKFITENTAIDYIEKIKFKKKNETEKIIKNKTAPNHKSASQIRRIINTTKVLEYLKTQPKINISFFEKISKIYLETTVYQKGFRKHEEKKMYNAFKPSKSKNIKSDLKKLLKWYENQKNKIHPLALAILFHNKFEKIRPYYNGNGDLGRITINYMLQKLNYPPIIINKKIKGKYFQSMNKAYSCLRKDLLNTDMKYYKDLMEFMQKQFVKTYWDNFAE